MTFLTGRGFLTGKGTRGQGVEGQRGCSAPGREQGRKRGLSDSSGFPGGSVVKNPLASAGAVGSIPELGRFPGGGDGNALQYSSPGKSHGQRRLAGLRFMGSQKSQAQLRN